MFVKMPLPHFVSFHEHVLDHTTIHHMKQSLAHVHLLIFHCTINYFLPSSYLSVSFTVVTVLSMIYYKYQGMEYITRLLMSYPRWSNETVLKMMTRLA